MHNQHGYGEQIWQVKGAGFKVQNQHWNTALSSEIVETPNN